MSLYLKIYLYYIVEVYRMENQKITLKRDYGFLKVCQKNTHTIKATNTKSFLSEVYVSIYACSKDLNINAGVIKLCCDKKKKLILDFQKLIFQLIHLIIQLNPLQNNQAEKSPTCY